MELKQWRSTPFSDTLHFLTTWRSSSWATWSPLLTTSSGTELCSCSSASSSCSTTSIPALSRSGTSTLTCSGEYSQLFFDSRPLKAKLLKDSEAKPYIKIVNKIKSKTLETCWFYEYIKLISQRLLIHFYLMKVLDFKFKTKIDMFLEFLKLNLKRIISYDFPHYWIHCLLPILCVSTEL